MTKTPRRALHVRVSRSRGFMSGEEPPALARRVAEVKVGMILPLILHGFSGKRLLSEQLSSKPHWKSNEFYHELLKKNARATNWQEMTPGQKTPPNDVDESNSPAYQIVRSFFTTQWQPKPVTLPSMKSKRRANSMRRVGRR